jgi:hypothetical protein
MPDGEHLKCREHRVMATVITCSAVVSMLLLVTVLRCCDCWRACGILCKPNQSSGGWMEWVTSQWSRSEGAREWLRPQWTLFVALLDVGSDTWVLVQVQLLELLTMQSDLSCCSLPSQHPLRHYARGLVDTTAIATHHGTSRCIVYSP